MQQTLVFTKVFKAEGAKNGKPWTRWDYKTAAEERFPHFSPTQEIALNSPVTVEINERGSIASVVATDAQTTNGTSYAPQSVNGVPLASQGASSNGVASNNGDAVGKTKAIIAAQMAPALFESLPADEQTLESARKIMDSLVQYAFSGTIPY